MNVRFIPMSNSDNIATVDVEDYGYLSNFNWHEEVRGYPVAIIDGKLRKMHRVIMDEYDPNVEIDHEDMNPFNNVKKNLRRVTHSQNMSNRSKLKRKDNTSEYKGVRFRKKFNSYDVRIQVDKKPIFIGTFSDEIAAANAYNHAAKQYHGNHARLNEVSYMSKIEVESFRRIKYDK